MEHGPPNIAASMLPFAWCTPHTSHFELKRAPSLSRTCACYLYGAHHADGTSSTLETSVLSKLGVRSARRTPRRSHFELGGLSGVPTKYRVCASGLEQSPSRAPSRVVLEKDFVRAGSSEVPLGHLRSSCLRRCLCERARTERISSHIGRNLRFVGDVEFV